MSETFDRLDPEFNDIDLKAAINAVSDVVQNRPRPLREFDQIYMKAGDTVMPSEFIDSWSKGRRLAVIGAGDAISVCEVCALPTSTQEA